jgi:hypothetical protein
MEQILKDRFGNRIGEIRKEGTYYWIVDRNGNRLGYYNPSTNTTYDIHGNKVAEGNFLTNLLINL